MTEIGFSEDARPPWRVSPSSKVLRRNWLRGAQIKKEERGKKKINGGIDRGSGNVRQDSAQTFARDDEYT